MTICRAALAVLLLAFPLDVFPQVDGGLSTRDRAAAILLEEGVDGLKTLLLNAGASALTFDQESQIRNLHDRYKRQSAELISENEADAEAITAKLAEQLLLASARFLNAVQREALGGLVEADTNSDLPTDESELREYLRDLVSPGASGGGNVVIDGFSGGRMPNRDEIMEIRINDNAFTSEQSDQGRGRTEIRTRGGSGNLNGDLTFNIQDESLDARNPFASSRPPYGQRDVAFNVSAPVIRNRVTTTFSFRNDASEEGDTLRAFTPNGLVTDAVTRRERDRDSTLRSTLQLGEGHALTFTYSYASENSENNGVGGFDLPEQASAQAGTSHNFQIQDTAVLSPRISHEARFRMSSESEREWPVTTSPRLTVRDAFTAGGSTNSSREDDVDFEFGNLLMYTGAESQVSLKAGLDGRYQREHSEARNNFNGTFTFSTVEDFLAGRPLQYSVNSGDPTLRVRQFEGAAFLQTDFRLSSRLTMGFGARYEAQSNLNDWNNLDPRFGLAYYIGGSTVLRAGSGIFHDRLDLSRVRDLQRFNGIRQQTLIVRNPSYPDPFLGGVRTVQLPSSVQTRADELAAPYTWNSEISLETTLRFGLALTASYRFIRGVHLFRTRNLNAPLNTTWASPRSCTSELADSACVRPDPARGNVVQLESTGLSSSNQLQIGFQQRLRFVNVRGNYTLRRNRSNVPGGGFSLPADNYDMSFEWGPDSPEHEVSTSVNFRLPWTIDLDTVFNWNSGAPYSLQTGRDDNRDTNTSDRPEGVYRNSLTSPSFFEMDLSFSKTFILMPEPEGSAGPLAEGGYFGRRAGIRMTLSAEADNVLNTFNADRISGVITSPFFGRPIRARDGRSISASLRFDF